MQEVVRLEKDITKTWAKGVFFSFSKVSQFPKCLYQYMNKKRFISFIKNKQTLKKGRENSVFNKI